MSRSRTTLLALTLTSGAALLILTGCGSSGTVAEVASLPSPAASSAAASAASAPAATSSAPDATAVPRPVMPVGMTDQQFATYYNTYHRCLIENGAKPSPAPAPVPGKPTLVNVAGPTPAAAVGACLHLAPLPAPELDAATNPDFHAESLAYVACLRQHGEWVTLLNDHNLDWTYTDGHPAPTAGGDFERDCMVRVFGGKR